MMVTLGCQGGRPQGTPGESPKKAPSNVDEKVIYGEDSRMDLFQVSNPQVLALAHSTVALIKSQKLHDNADGSVSILGQNFGSSFGMCSNEPFIDQDSAAFCSGSLIGRDTVLTAGHCVTSEADCSGMRIIFGFSVNQPGALPRSVSSADIYLCAGIIHQEQDDSGADFALIRLDRPVSNHPPLAVRESGSVSVGDQLLVIGQPSGLPTKVAMGAVRNATPAGYFVTNLDTYGGNSGSAVFNSQSGLIEGVLVRGEEDFAQSADPTTGRACLASNRCSDEGCRGEDVTRISNVLPYLPSDSPVDSYSSMQPLDIPDNESDGIKSDIEVDKLPDSRQVFVGVNISHTYVGDLVVTITAPDGRFQILSNREGGSQQNLVNTFAADDLSDEKQTGKWSLSVSDNAAADVGVLHSWGVTFK